MPSSAKAAQGCAAYLRQAAAMLFSRALGRAGGISRRRLAQSRAQSRGRSRPGLLREFADALLEAKADEAAIRLVKGQKKNWQSHEWLAKYYRERGTPEQAL